MKHIFSIFLMLAIALCGFGQEAANIFGTGRGNLKLKNGVFIKTRPNGTLVAEFPPYITYDSLGKYLDTFNFNKNDCTDSLWKITTDIYHRNTACQVQVIPSGSGCLGGRVYKKANLGDTSSLSPSPVCGDILAITSDTCFDMLFIRGSSPSAWNNIGFYLKNQNCASFCYEVQSAGIGESIIKYYDCDSLVLWKIRGQGGITVTKDASGILIDGAATSQVDSLLTVTASSSLFRFRHDPNGSTNVSINAGTGINFSDGTTGKLGSITINANENNGRLHTNIGTGRGVVKLSGVDAAENAQFKSFKAAGVGLSISDTPTEITYTLTPDNDGDPMNELQNLSTTGLTGGGGIGYFKTSLTTLPAGGSIRLNAGNNIKITKTTDGLDGIYSIEALRPVDSLQVTAASTSAFTFGHWPDNTSTVTLKAGVGLNFSDYSTSLPHSNGETRINVDTSSNVFNGFEYTMSNIGTGAGIWKQTTGSGPKDFELRKLKSNTLTITQNNSDISIESVGLSQKVCPQPGIPLVDQQDVLMKVGSDSCMTVNSCGWDLGTVTGDAYNVMIQQADFSPYYCLRRCAFVVTDCVAMEQSIQDPNMVASVKGKTDNSGLFSAIVSVLNSHTSRLEALETPINANVVNASSKDMNITTMQVARRVYEQQKLIDKQAKLIEELTARLDRLDRLQASK